MNAPPLASLPDAGGPRLHTLLLALLALAMVGALAELLLLGHYEDTVQWIPVALLGVGLPVVGWSLIRPGRRALLAVRAVMAALLVAGLLGLWFHYRGNMEFELEMDAGLKGLALAWETVRGATPALAPGTLIQFGLLGFLATYRHPALRPHPTQEGAP